MATKPTRIQDVARVAGVSTATVSRTLSHPGKVTESTRDQVHAAIRATGYRLNQAARNLRRQRTGGIVVLIPNLANPFFSQILSGIAEVMAPAGYNVLIADTKTGPDSEAGILDYLHHNRADGLIVLDGNLPATVLEQSADHPAMVFACEWAEGTGAPRVRIDNFEGARLAIRHLARLGHRRIFHIAGPPGNVLTRERRHGVEAELASQGLTCRADWFLGGPFSLAAGALAAEHWIALSEQPTAVFCASDEIAFGFTSKLLRRGFSVPGDVSVVGFDDIELAAHITPALTTIRQPRKTIGTTAASALLGLIGDPGNRTQESDIVLPLELIVRDSTSPPAEKDRNR